MKATMDSKEQKGLAQIDRIFSIEVEQSVKNVISQYSELGEVELRKKIEEIIKKYFNQSIGIEKMGVMLSARGCVTSPGIFLEQIKQMYLDYYKTARLPKVNTQATLQKISDIEDELEKRIDEILKDRHRGLGFCHIYWATKKKILLEDYGIVWYSPAECNPNVMYD